MTLKEQLLADLKAAMKNKEKVKKDTITMIRAAILQEEKDKKITLDDDQIIVIASKQLKQRKDSLEDFKKANREDLIDQTLEEIKVIESYLPKQLDQDELTAIVQETIDELGVCSKKDMGKVMKTIMPKVAGQADGKQVNKIVQNILK